MTIHYLKHFQRVLVTEFIEGIKISEKEILGREKISLADVNYKLFEAFGYQIFQTGFVHADPHSGNSEYQLNLSV